MRKEIRQYLEWRFRVNNHPKYQQYRDEWIDNLLPNQIQYFEQEMVHLYNKGIYK